MDFLRSLVPAVISGDGPVEHGGVLPGRETGPRLLRIKRLGLLAMGQTIEEVDPMVEVDPGIGLSKPARRNRTRLKGTPDAVVTCIDIVFTSANQLGLFIEVLLVILRSVFVKL